MARFARTNKGYINVESILEVHELDGGSIEILFASGIRKCYQRRWLDEIIGNNAIRNIIRVSDAGFIAQFRNRDAGICEVPVHFIAVTENGSLEPVEAESSGFSFLKNIDGYVGMFREDET